MKRKLIAVVLIYTTLLLQSCSVNTKTELLYGQYPEPLLIAVAINPDVDKDVKELTRNDLKKIRNYHFLNEFDKKSPDKQYGFEDNKEYDFSIILEMPNLTMLDIDLGDKIRLKDYSILNKLSNLESLSIGNITDSDIQNLEKLTSLTGLYISHSKITNINFLEHLNQLTSFGLDDVPSISNFEPLKYLNAVYSINIINSRITEDKLNTIPDLKTLRLLTLYNNNINTITVFPKLPNLQTLILSKNPITNIFIAPDRLPNLKTLVLADTPISDLNSLSGINTIEEIYLWRTNVKKVSPLKSYKNLKFIYANLENIEDKEQLLNTGINLLESD